MPEQPPPRHIRPEDLERYTARDLRPFDVPVGIPEPPQSWPHGGFLCGDLPEDDRIPKLEEQVKELAESVEKLKASASAKYVLRGSLWLPGRMR